MDELIQNKPKEIASIAKAPQERSKPGPKKKEVLVEPVVPVETREITYQDAQELRKRAAKEKWMKERDHKAKLVTGKFLFNECPGGELVFNFREFPGEPNVKYTMRHDTIHTIPLGVAMHLNDNCAYPEYSHNLDGGKAISGAGVDGSTQNMYIQTKIHRTNFIPLDFTLNAGNTTGNSIAQVTYNNPLSTNQILDSMGR